MDTTDVFKNKIFQVCKYIGEVVKKDKKKDFKRNKIYS